MPPTGDEIQRLGETLNEMLDRLEAGLERERDFVADAGHELRTPLALLRTELELALRQAQTAEELRDAVRGSSFEVDRLAQLAEDLLLIARADRGPPAAPDRAGRGGRRCFASIASRFEWRARGARQGRDVGAGGGLVVEADRMRLEQALGNLVDNALRHGGDDGRPRRRGSDGGTSSCTSATTAAASGRDFLDARVRALHARRRGTRRRRRGLGLSIVRTIAEAHGGTAHVANRADGGADVWVALPAR